MSGRVPLIAGKPERALEERRLTPPMRAGLVLAICMALPGGLVAQEDRGEHAAESEDHAAAEGEHGEAHEHKNHIALFIGSTQAEIEHGERDDPQFTLGIDYERRLTPIFGVGALLDLVLEGHREGIVGIPLFLHAGNLVFEVAPAGERIRDTGEWAALLRLGVLYEFEIGSNTAVFPSAFYDVTEEGGTWVLGGTVGWGF